MNQRLRSQVIVIVVLWVIQIDKPIVTRFRIQEVKPRIVCVTGLRQVDLLFKRTAILIAKERGMGFVDGCGGCSARE